ncbi:MAG: molybdenum ABC transporter permease [Gemmatimonas sp. SG8_23]|nr:MAG: molybdenum ABC transporter permease [Gemmatimonas sp. SG8_23]
MSAPRSRIGPSNPVAVLLGFTLVLLLSLPLAALALSASPDDLRTGVASPLFAPALALSLRTTFVSLVVTVLTGTPLAWWLATSSSRTARAVEVVVDLPIVIPPAVIGVALLQTFGRRGLLGPPLDALGVGVPFTERAVLLAQVVVSAPFFVQAAANAFRKVDLDILIVARTLGASPTRAFFRIAIPIARPGLVVGASLAWARALGEFGATLLFAGNLPGRTQTMPLAILSALESDVRVAIVFSLVLAALGTILLIGLRLAPSVWATFAGRGAPAATPLGRGR